MGARLNRLLLGYSVVMTTAVAGLFATQAISQPDKAVFGEIDVQRINLREADGTLRMVISNTDRMPGIIHKGVNHPHPNRRTAGILFFNEEGTENGGLTFGGRRDAQGRVIGSSGHLSFDQFEQDQVVVLNQSESPDGTKRGGLTISDRPDKPLPFDAFGKMATATPAEREALTKELIASGAVDVKQRVFVGKTGDRSSAVMLSDAAGKPRILMLVKADGAAEIQFLGDDGKPVKTIGPAAG
ncbi:MAG: hypothetical protein IT546_07105 [Caulobacteraceae bacterium]|nr:hypothetical protein [Caulobacteraceae bacterium]